MKRAFLSSVFTLAVFSLIITSCVNQEYDIEELNTEMTIGAAGLAIPLGSTEQLKIQDFLDSNDVSILSKDESGVFSISIGDTLSLSDNIPDLSEMLSIGGVSFDAPYSFALSGLGQDISVDENVIENTFSLGGKSLMDELLVPSVSIEESISAGIADLMPSEDELSLDLEDMSYEKDHIYEKGNISALPLVGDGEISIPDGLLPSRTLETKTYQMEINLTLPEGIKSISEITMNPDAKVQCSLSITDPFISKGKVTPAIDVDLSQLLEIDGANDPIHLSELVLSETNNYTASKQYPVTAFNIDPSEWDGNTLSVTKEVSVSGSVSVSGAATTKAAVEASENMRLELSVTYIDMNVDNVKMEIDPVEVAEGVDVSLDIPEMELPAEVKSVGKITIDPESEVSYSIDAKNLISGLNLKMETLKFVFPEGMEVEGADADGVLLVEDVDLSTPYKGTLNILSITPSAPKDGKFVYDGNISVEVACVADGEINTKELPTDVANDLSISTKIEADLKISDCEIATNKVVKDLDVEPQKFVIDFPGEVADFGTFVVTPEGEPEVVININLPESSFDINFSEEGLLMVLPEMLVLKDLDPSLNYNQENHSIHLKGDIPSKITLPVKELVVTPVANEDGSYQAVSELSVSGAIMIPESTITGKELDKFVSEGIGLVIDIPAMEAESISVQELSFGISETESFTILSAKDFPKELVEISNVDIEETRLKVSFAAENLPDFGKNSVLGVDILVTLPEFIVPNEIPLKGEIKNGKFEQEFTITDLDLSGVDFSKGEDLVAEIVIDGAVSVSEPTVDLGALSEEDVELNLSASIADINITKVEGKVDYAIDNLTETVSLEDLPDFLRNDDVCLDIDNPHIILNVNTNVGIPISGTLQLKALRDGVEIPNTGIELDLVLPYSESSDQMAKATLWIGGSDAGVPADATFLEANLANLIKAVPDEIVITVEGGTDPSKTSIIESAADYVLDLDYKFVVPLAFGEDMKFALSDTLDVSEAGIGEILKMGEIHLVGVVENSLPLQFELAMDLLDGDDQVMDVEPVSQTIKPCNSDATASTSPLKLALVARNGTDMTKLAKIKVSFVITSKNVSGIPITEDCYIQAKIGLNLPKGITLNLGDE